MSDTKLSFNEDCMVHFAMRYALGRQTAAPSIVCSELKRLWQFIPQNTRVAMQAEIRNSIEASLAGAACDVEQWQSILALAVGPPDAPVLTAAQKAVRMYNFMSYAEQVALAQGKLPGKMMDDAVAEGFNLNELGLELMKIEKSMSRITA